MNSVKCFTNAQSGSLSSPIGFSSSDVNFSCRGKPAYQEKPAPTMYAVFILCGHLLFISEPKTSTCNFSSLGQGPLASLEWPLSNAGRDLLNWLLDQSCS